MRNSWFTSMYHCDSLYFLLHSSGVLGFWGTIWFLLRGLGGRVKLLSEVSLLSGGAGVATFPPRWARDTRPWGRNPWGV